MPDLSPLSSPEERRAYVAWLRQAIADGTYDVDAEAVAAALVHEVVDRSPGAFDARNPFSPPGTGADVPLDGIDGYR